MNLEVEANGPTSTIQVSKSSKCKIKDISQRSNSSSSSSTEKSDMSAPDDLGNPLGITVNGISSMDQNQNCTAAPGVVAASFEAADDDDPNMSITEGPEKVPSEEELLRQLEEANRLLEADEKSYPARAAFSATPGHSRKGSESSIVSSTSSNSFYSHQNSNKVDDSNGHSTESLWEIWGRIINDWDSVKKKQVFLRELVRKGIPHEFRGMAWQLILGVHDSSWKQEYAEHMKKKSPCEKLIRRDIARTFPDHDFFKEKDGFGQESLFNVMKAYSLHDREVGYCQGSGFIVGLLLMQMPEEDAFAVLVHLMEEFRLRELFKPSMAELGLCMFKLECLIQELLPTLLVHFQTQNFDTSMYASSWFLTLYVTSLPLSLARRIMDLFVSEGMEMIFRVGVAILQSCQDELLTLDMEGLLKYLQKDLRGRFEQEADQDNLLHTAYNIKYSQKKMKKLEKEYTALKTKENEDQIELRRLRTENRLLRQRIDNLEKVEAKLLRQNEESSTLADKLVQDQVTWAQEVEQSYALRNELSVLHQQLQETQKKLFQAEDIIGDIRTRTRIIQDAVHLDEAEERNMIKHLQEELIAVRLRESDTAITIKELKLKISDLEDTNLRLQRAPSNDVQQLQEELIAVKLREAEANLSMKELHMKVNEIESYWEAHMERVRQSSPKEKGSKLEMRHLQEEVMALKLKEARAVADLKDAKQKLMELETQNHICTNQIRRIGEENKELKKQIEEASEREKDLRTNIKDLTRKLDDTESKRKEETMMARIKDAENIQLLAELRHRIAEIDIQKEEVLAAGQLQDKGENQELKNKLHDLQDEVLQLQLSLSNQSRPAGRCVMTDSYLGNNSDEELDAEIKDSENLDRTLTDIIEGKTHSLSSSSVQENEDIPISTLTTLLPFPSRSAQQDVDSSMEPNEYVHNSNAGNTLSSQSAASDSHSGDDASNTSTSTNVNKTVSGRLSAGDRGFISLPRNSVEGSVIDNCDTAKSYSSDDTNDVKGKGYTSLQSLNSSRVRNVSKIDSCGKKDYTEAAVNRVVGDHTDCVERIYKTDVSNPDQHFPESWELYEEVVEIDLNQKARVISRISSSIITGGDENSSIEIGNVGVSHRSTNSMERMLNPKPSSAKSLGKTYNESARDAARKHGKDVRVSTDKECVESQKMDEIPDVLVIYEPSCATSSLMCSCDGSDEQDFMLKESTV
ncbi:hypothetical protein BsWGS_23709 [Bradybaena similaris]